MFIREMIWVVVLFNVFLCSSEAINIYLQQGTGEIEEEIVGMLEETEHVTQSN